MLMRNWVYMHVYMHIGSKKIMVMVNEELDEKVVEVRSVSDGVMAVVKVLEGNVLILTCGYAQQN